MSKPNPDLNEEVRRLIESTRKEFGRINADKKQITPGDREQLKTLYIEEFFLPQARLILQKYFPSQTPAESQGLNPQFQ